MPLSDDFNDNDYRATKINGFVLGVTYGCGNGNSTYYTYDFLARVLTVRTGSSDGGTIVTPFSQLDRDGLIALRDKLVELKGNPPELGPEKPSVSAASAKLNL